MSHYTCKVCHQYYDDCDCSSRKFGEHGIETVYPTKPNGGKTVVPGQCKNCSKGVFDCRCRPDTLPGGESDIIRAMGVEDEFTPVRLPDGYGETIQPERDIIKHVFEVSDEITAGGYARYVPAILAKSTEELGELSTEVGIKYFGFYKQPGKDGIFGEACDVINCMLDIIHVSDPNITAEMVYDKIAEKTAKWKQKTIGN